MIGYDLDGVLLSDMVVTEENLQRMLSTRVEEVYPSFEPAGDYAIITGRPVEDRKSTVEWMRKFLKNQPKHLYHSNTDFSKPQEYKLEVLEKSDFIDTFIESDLEQVIYLKKHLKRNIKIIHFNSLINETINQQTKG